MSISSVYSGGSSGASPDYSADPVVQHLEAKIKDWANCPTTDPTTKRKIVGQLQDQLDGAEAAIKQSDEAKQVANPAKPRGLDIYA